MRQPKSRPLLAFHDGQLTDRREAMLLSLYLTLIHFGGIIVPPGYTDPCKFVDGNPYGASLVTTHDNINEFDQVTSDALEHLARRVVTFADRLTS
jgi:NAD(P)H dehydrogenase (quinone)